jgi:hypothetical protein
MNLKAFFPIVGSIVIGLGFKAVWGCSGGDCEPTSNLFDPMVIKDTAAAPLFRDDCRPFFDYDEQFGNKNAIYYRQNIIEWSGYFNKTIPDSTIAFMLYDANLAQIDSALFIISKKINVPANPPKFASLLAFSDKAAPKAFLYYIGFARRCEPWVTVSDSWEERQSDDSAKARAEIDTLIKAALKQLPNVKNKFLRERYLFQMIRLYFASARYDECIAFYKQYAKEFTVNASMKYRSLGYVAASHYRQKDFSTADYYYAVQYRMLPAQRKTAIFSFHLQSGSEWDETLEKSNDPKIKETLWFLNGLYGDPVNAMVNLYTLNSLSEYLPLLCTRAINLEEEKIMSNDDKVCPVDAHLLGIITKIANERKHPKAWVWNLAAAHLAAYAGKNAEVEKYLAAIGKDLKNDPVITRQMNISRFIAYMYTHLKIDKTFVTDINDYYTQFSSTHNDSADYAYATAADWGRHKLSARYAAQGKIVIAHCLEPTDDFYNDNGKIESLIDILQKGSDGPSKAFILSVVDLSTIDNLRAIEALNAVGKERYADAVKYIKLAKAHYSQSCKNPFAAYMNDWTTASAISTDSDSEMTRLAIMEKALAYSTLAKQNSSGSAEAYYRLGNFRFNIFKYGTSYAFSATPSGSANEALYALPAVSLAYFDSALAKKPSKELKAQIYAMMAKYELYTTDYETYNNTLPSVQDNKGYKKLKQECSETEFYKEMIRDCGYFKKYLGTKN